MHDRKLVGQRTSGGVARKRMRLCTCPIYRTETVQQPIEAPASSSNANCQLDELRNKQSKEDFNRHVERGLNGLVRAKTEKAPLEGGVEDHWSWDVFAKSQEVSVYGEHKRTVLFHPGWSNGTAAIRGTKRLNGTVSYWEIEVSHRLFGTSLMFGIGTADSALYENSFVNLIGQDEHSWGLSHKGKVWHKGIGDDFCPPFVENQPVIVGLLFDGQAGTLSYYKNGVSQGVAFKDLHLVDKPIYPMISSTAARTEMSIGVRRRKFASLQDRCLSIVVEKFYNNCRNRADAKRPVNELPIPFGVREKILELLPES